MAERVVALVAPHFTPSNLAGVHRARLLSQHLAEFGWRPLVVTTHPRHYEEEPDDGLDALVDPSLEIVRTAALPVGRPRIVGDIGLRAMPWHLAALERLRRAGRFDFLHITVPSFYSAMLGPLLHARAPLPYGVDYIDPWIHASDAAAVRFTRAWASMRLAEALEPWAVGNAALVTGVAEGYYAGVIDRNPRLRGRCVTAAMPYGFSERDFAAPKLDRYRPTLFDPDDGNIHLVYAGALLPKAVAVVERFLAGLAALRAADELAARRIRVHFVGTGTSPQDSKGHNVQPMAARARVADLVTEHPHRMPYLDVLGHLKRADGILIFGSTERHYTPSKVYQAVQARRPVLAFLHHTSTAVAVLRDSRAGQAVTLSEGALPSPEEMADALKRFLAAPYRADDIDWGAFSGFSARESARRMAAALDEASSRWRAAHHGAPEV